MTVGIGVVCQKGKCVIMAADGKGSFENDAFPAHERIGKQHRLPFGLCANIAGTIEICNAVMSRIATALDAHPPRAPLGLDFLQSVAEAARFAEFKRHVDAEFKRSLGITLEEWQQTDEAHLRWRMGWRIINRSFLPVELLIGGIVRGSGVVVHFEATDIARADWLACIGTGGADAYGRLMARSQEVHMSIPRTMIHIAEAMEVARLAKPDTVGAPSDFVVITERQTRRMPAKSPVLAKMVEKYAGVDSDEADSDGSLWRLIQSAMYVPGISKEEYDAGLRHANQRATPSGSQT